MKYNTLFSQQAHHLHEMRHDLNIGWSWVGKISEPNKAQKKAQTCPKVWGNKVPAKAWVE